jgi:single-strand DNA-binding protein
MASLNKCILIGRLGKDPELKFTTSGKAVTKFSLATSEKWKNKGTNEPMETTTWHNIVVWGEQGETVSKYIRKGSQVYVEGRISNREYDDKNGIRRYTSEVVADRVIFLDSAERGEEVQKAKSAGKHSERSFTPAATEKPVATDSNEDNLADLPF